MLLDFGFPMYPLYLSSILRNHTHSSSKDGVGVYSLSMEQDIQELIKKNLELTKENNKLLKKMRRNAFLGGLLKLVWIAVIIGLPVYIYFNFLAPVLDQVLDAAQSVQDVGGKVEGLQSELQDQLKGSGVKEFLDNFFNKQ